MFYLINIYFYILVLIKPLPATPTVTPATSAKKRKRYTVEEENIIREYWGKIPRKDIAEMLDGRSVEDIRGKARHLGISK